MKRINPELAARAEAAHIALQLLKRYADPASTVSPEGKRILLRAAMSKAAGRLTWPGASTRNFNPDPIAPGDVVIIREKTKYPWGEVRETTFKAVIVTVTRSEDAPTMAREYSREPFLYASFKPLPDQPYICQWGTVKYYTDGEPQPEWGSSIMAVMPVDVLNLPNEV